MFIQKRFKKSLKHFEISHENAVEIFGEFTLDASRVYSNVGMCHLWLENFEEAEKILLKAW